MYQQTCYSSDDIRTLFITFYLNFLQQKKYIENPHSLYTGLRAIHSFYFWIQTLYHDDFLCKVCIVLDRASIQEKEFTISSVQKDYRDTISDLEKIFGELSDSTPALLFLTSNLIPGLVIEPFVLDDFFPQQGEIIFDKGTEGYIEPNTIDLVNIEVDPQKVIEYKEVVSMTKELLDSLLENLEVIKNYFQRYIYFENDNPIIVPIGYKRGKSVLQNLN